MSRDSAFLNRRMLLAGLGAGAVGVATAAPILTLRLTGPAEAARASWWDRTFVSLQAAGIAEWSALVGESFNLQTAKGSNILRVAAVTAFPRSGSRPAALARSQAFAVVFESISGPPLPLSDKVYELAHRSYKSLPIYMGVPTSVAQKTRLVAVFN
ncbi:MAG: hypothetical protein ABIR60_06800 [Allosphingosinicella sp.]